LLKQINVGLCSKYLGEARGHWANRNSSSAANALAKLMQVHHVIKKVFK